MGTYLIKLVTTYYLLVEWIITDGHQGVARISEKGGQINSPVSARAIILKLYSYLLSGLIAPQKIITTGLDAIIMVPYISLCSDLGWHYNYRGAYKSRYIMTDLSS